MLTRLRALFSARGFDIVHPFETSWVRHLGKAGNLHHLLDDDDDRVGLLIGNTKNIWPYFVDSLRANELPANPLDTFVEREIRELTIDMNVRDIFFTHDSNRVLCFRRLASCTNLAHFSDDLGLCIHNVFGAWIAFRAVVVLNGVSISDLGVPVSAPKRPLKFPCSDDTKAAAAKQMQRLIAGEDHDWLRLRDTVVIGRQWRYEMPQLQFHYASSPMEREVILRRCIPRATSLR